jgi:hypothetical protein
LMSRDRWRYHNRYMGHWASIDEWLWDPDVDELSADYITLIDLPGLKVVKASFIDSLHVYIREDLIDAGSQNR